MPGCFDTAEGALSHRFCPVSEPAHVGEGSSGLCQGVSTRQKVRWTVCSVPPLNLHTRERGDERAAPGRPDATEGALSDLFCPPLKPEP